MAGPIQNVGMNSGVSMNSTATKDFDMNSFLDMSSSTVKIVLMADMMIENIFDMMTDRVDMTIVHIFDLMFVRIDIDAAIVYTFDVMPPRW